ncbi:MAG: c-type cytochrome [Sulfitobacter sp.]|nr:c-type cytochrome [Sulfitobacter sp.]
MSKSLNFLLPTVGGIALLGGIAIASMHRNSGEAQIALLRDRVAEVEAHAKNAGEKVKMAASRAEELQAEIAEVQAAAQERMAQTAVLTAPAPETDEPYGIGRPALTEEIAAWDVDVLPDGRGLPEGSGNAFDGEEVFAAKCASCHGDFAEGVDNWPVLAGGFDTLGDEDPVKTVGSYWPHLSTAWDYIHRSMPFGEAGTLTADETYAIVAYILYSNDLIDDEYELSHENLGEFEMYNKDGFVVDDRPELEYTKWRTEPCMENCKEEVEVTMRSVFLVETPPEGGSKSEMNQATLEALPTFTAAGPSFIPEAAPKPAVAEEAEPEATPAAVQPTEGVDLVAAGEKVFRKCKSCHQVGSGAKNRSGPVLTGIVGAPAGSVDGFKYSKAMASAGDAGLVWETSELDAFLADPKGYLKKTKMSFKGLDDEEDRAAVIAYLNSFE